MWCRHYLNVNSYADEKKTIGEMRFLCHGTEKYNRMIMFHWRPRLMLMDIDGFLLFLGQG